MRRMARKTWYRVSDVLGRMLKIVVRMERARPVPFWGEDFMGELRLAQILGRNLSRLGDWRVRWIRRLYAAVNSIRSSMSVV